jgi:multimeric flavodoxin WrbA
MKKKKLVAFNGSPRKQGYSAKLVAEAIRGAELEGAEVARYDLNEKNIRGCQGCYYCRINEGCSIKNDYLAPMYADIKDANGILISAPIYLHNISGQVKILLDRLFPMASGFDFHARYPNKKIGTIFSQGNSDENAFKPQITTFNDFISSYCRWSLVDSIICCGTSDSDFKDNIMNGNFGKFNFKIHDELLHRSFVLGKELVK